VCMGNRHTLGQFRNSPCTGRGVRVDVPGVQTLDMTAGIPDSASRVPQALLLRKPFFRLEPPFGPVQATACIDAILAKPPRQIRHPTRSS
jgi:hypothetical protein